MICACADDIIGPASPWTTYALADMAEISGMIIGKKDIICKM